MGVAVPDPCAVEVAATVIQCPNVVLVIGVPPTLTTALPGMPPPQAAKPTTANKTAPSAGMKRSTLDTTRAL